MWFSGPLISRLSEHLGRDSVCSAYTGRTWGQREDKRPKLFASSTEAERRPGQTTDLAKADEEMVYLFVEFGGQPRLQVEPTREKVNKHRQREPGQSSFSSHLVSSGFFVGGLCHLSLLVIRCTWTSTPMPTFLIAQLFSTMLRKIRWDGITHISQAACRHRKAILGPTPGSEHSSSTVLGTSESNSSRRRCAACLMYLIDPSYENFCVGRQRED